MIPKPKCECCDAGCPAHRGRSQCVGDIKTILVRVDMQDEMGTAFCTACANDALESGLFYEDVGLKIRCRRKARA